MQKLNLPDYQFRIKSSDNSDFVFDELRKKYLLLTPEEWVRQNIIKYIIEEKKVPAGLISLEAGVEINSLKRRYDALVHSKSGKPFILIECKAPDVAITKKVFEQITAYNSKIAAPYMLITNGLKHFFLRLHATSGKFIFEQEMPLYTQLINGLTE